MRGKASAEIKNIEEFVRGTAWQDMKDIVLTKVYEGDRVFDYGSGLGFLLEAIDEEEPGAILYGMEESLILRNMALNRLTKAYFLNTTKLYDLRPMDVITCVRVLPRESDPWALLTFFHRLLKSDGTLILMVPDPIIGSIMSAWRRLVYRGIARNRWSWSVQRLRHMLESRGFRVKKVHGVGKRVFGFAQAHVFVCEKRDVRA
jgi:SAM-dependent methyltransferase